MDSTLSGRVGVGEAALRARVASALFGEEETIYVGDYRLIREIGRGGLGVVYVAHDPELDRRVALKFIRPEAAIEMGAKEVHARVQREAQAMAKLRHPNVVSVYAVGNEDGSVYIVMELVDGVTLGRWLAQSDRPWAEVRDVLVSAGQGLVAAHEQGIVHRDFKPGNVLVESSGVARVLDFGLALPLGTREDSSGTSATSSVLHESVTQTGVIMGTPAYMAPEQFDGGVSEKVDQWAFCVTTYEALYGTRPFHGRTFEEGRDAIRSADPPEPPRDSRVPGWVFRVLRRGLSKDPSARFESMSALLDALQRDRRSKRRRLLGVAGAVGLAAAASVVTALVLSPSPSPADHARISALVDRAREAAAEGLFLYPPPEQPDVVTAYGGIVALESFDGPAESLADEAAAELRREIGGQLVTLGDAYWEMPGGRGWAADFYASARAFDTSTPRALERSMMTRGELAALRQSAADGAFSSSELDAASVLIPLGRAQPEGRVDALALARRIRETRRPEPPVPEPPASPKPAARVEVDVGETSSSRPEPAEPKPTRDRDRARREAREGRAALAADRLDEAQRHFHRALEADSRSAEACSGLAEVNFERGKHTAAIDYATRATKLAPKTGKYHLQLGDALMKVLRYGEARREYERAEQLGHPKAARALERLERRLEG